MKNEDCKLIIQTFRYNPEHPRFLWGRSIDKSKEMDRVRQLAEYTSDLCGRGHEVLKHERNTLMVRVEIINGTIPPVLWEVFNGGFSRMYWPEDVYFYASDNDEGKRDDIVELFSFERG